jgi:hypothetical protein
MREDKEACKLCGRIVDTTTRRGSSDSNYCVIDRCGLSPVIERSTEDIVMHRSGNEKTQKTNI